MEIDFREGTEIRINKSWFLLLQCILYVFHAVPGLSPLELKGVLRAIDFLAGMQSRSFDLRPYILPVL
jgi:hypothetical protein